VQIDMNDRDASMSSPRQASAANTAAEQLVAEAAHSHRNPQHTPTPSSLPRSLSSRLSASGAILFDLDGTLVESAQIWYELINAAAIAFGYPSVQHAEWKQTFGQSMESNVKHWMAGLEQQRFNDYCDDHYGDWLHHLHMLDGSFELLQAARHRYKTRLAIVTNCPRKITQIILSHLQLEEYFSHTVCAGDSIPVSSLPPALRAKAGGASTYTLKPKPETDILLYGAHLLDASVTESVFVGDSRYDMEAGSAAGCLCVGVGIATGDVFCDDTRAAVALFE